MKRQEESLPQVGSVWLDTDSGYAYKYKGVDQEEPFKGRLHLVRFDRVTGEEHEGGLYIGAARFKDDMVPASKAAKHPCCGQPTVFPIVWCDDCGYEKWSAARNAIAKATASEGAV